MHTLRYMILYYVVFINRIKSKKLINVELLAIMQHTWKKHKRVGRAADTTGL